MKKDCALFNKELVKFDDCESVQFIYSDNYQSLSWPEEYPAFIQIHSEWPIQSVPLHWHLGPELIYSRNQEILLMIEMEKIIIHPGECALISSREIHAIEPQKKIKNQDVMSITFDGAYLEKMFPDLRNTKLCFTNSSAEKEDQNELIAYCEKMRTQLDEKPLDFFAVNESLYGILKLIFKKFTIEKMKEKRNSKLNHQKMSEVLNYMEKHYQEKLTAQSVAKEFGYSREYFCRLFKRYADVSFKQYIMEYRLMKASVALYTTQKRILDIAYENGFPDEKSFYNSFRKKYEMTPLEFRKEKYKSI